MLKRKWDKAEMPRTPGTHRVLLGEHLVTKLGERESHARVEAQAQVKTSYYLGTLPVKLRGLQNAQTDGVVTRQITFSYLEVKDGKESGLLRAQPQTARIDERQNRRRPLSKQMPGRMKCFYHLKANCPAIKNLSISPSQLPRAYHSQPSVGTDAGGHSRWQPRAAPEDRSALTRS